MLILHTNYGFHELFLNLIFRVFIFEQNNVIQYLAVSFHEYWKCIRKTVFSVSNAQWYFSYWQHGYSDITHNGINVSFSLGEIAAFIIYLYRVREMCQSCQTWPAKFGQILLRTDTRLVFCNRKLMRTDIFFTRTTKPICNFKNSACR